MSAPFKPGWLVPANRSYYFQRTFSTGWPYLELATTNPALPLGQWQRVVTNSFDGAGNFSFTNVMIPGAPQKFHRLQLINQTGGRDDEDGIEQMYNTNSPVIR